MGEDSRSAIFISRKSPAVDQRLSCSRRIERGDSWLKCLI